MLSYTLPRQKSKLVHHRTSYVCYIYVCVFMMYMFSLIDFDCRSGVSLSPLVVCRLLLVMDYLLYQFSGPPSQLTEQVYILD